MARSRLLVVYHSQTGGTHAMAEAICRGAAHPDAGQPELRCLRAGDAGVEALMWCDGLVLGTPENFGTLSGGLKDFFDRTFYPAQGKVEGRPVAMFIKAGNDGSGALRAMRRIAKGYPLKEVREPLVCTGPVTAEVEVQCEELGMSMALGLELGLF